MDTRTNRRRGVGRGFTLLEMMLVVMIMGVLMGIAAWNLIGQGDKAKRAATITTMKQIEGMLSTYYLDYGAFPTSLDNLVPKYTTKKPVDAWKREIKYVPNPGGSPHPYQLYSTGQSGDQGGTDNIDFWTSEDTGTTGG